MRRSARRQLLRVEVATMAGSGVAGGVLLPLGGTATRMYYFLFGWAGGCVLHLLTLVARDRIERRRRAR